ncbi:MAG: type II secretion system F family protein [Bosea sp. (in: a-proteobacteria)]
MDISALSTAFLAMVAVGGVAYVFIYPLLSGEARAEKRQQALVEDGSVRVRRGSDPETKRRESVASSLKEIEAREKERTKLTLSKRLLQAGLDWHPRKFYMVSVVSAILTAIILFVTTQNLLLLPVGLLIGAIGIPFWFMGFMKNKRIKAFLNELPNALDVITRGLKSGLPLADCLRMISAEAAEPLKTEFRLIVEAQSLGISIGDAALKLFERVPIPEANFFGIVLSIQQKTGGNLAESLSNLSKVVRERRKMKNKVQAVSMEAKASAGIIACLPITVALLVYATSPAYIEKLWITEAGRIVLMGCGIWMFFGVMIMRKMINFDI